MANPAEALDVHIADDPAGPQFDPATQSLSVPSQDGGVVVQFGAHDPDAPQKPDNEEWFRNLVDDIDPNKLMQIAEELIESITADDESRKGYLETRARAFDLLGLKIDPPKDVASDGASVEGMSTVTNPLMLEIVLKSWANAQAELLPASGPVKIKDDGDETAIEDDLAEALERDMNHWFTTTASEYYPDTSHMLLWGTCFSGSGFKKVYRCPMRQRPVAESVAAADLIVSDTTKDLKSCGRITHQIIMRPSVMKRMKLIGAYRDVDLTQPTPTTDVEKEKVLAIQGTSTPRTRPEDEPYTVWESQCELDLPEYAPGKFKGKGIPLPYLVTLDKDSREILAIRRDWDEDDENAERKRLYVKYEYVPGPGFYGTGLLNIVGNCSAAMTAAWREALDAGMFASFPGGLIAKGNARQNSNLFRMAPGQFMPVETGGMPINNVVMPAPYRDVTPGLLKMIEQVIAQAKSTGGAAEIPAAEGLQNVPVGTMLAQIEQATKVLLAAHKGMHQAQALELELIIDLFRDHPEDFWRFNRTKEARGFWNEQKFLTALDDVNLIPVSDPNVPSHIHRIAKAIGLLQLAQTPVAGPYLNPKEVTTRCLRAMREDPNGLLIDPPPQAPGTSPEEAKVAEAQATIRTAQAKEAEAQMKLQMLPMQNALDLAKLQTEQQVHSQDLQREAIIHQGDMVKAAQQSQTDQRQHQIDTVKTAADIQDQQHSQSLDVAKHQLDTAKAAHDARMDMMQFGHDRQMDVAQHQHDVAQADREHQLNKQTADREHSLAVRQADDAAQQHERDSQIAEKQAKQKAQQAKPKAKK